MPDLLGFATITVVSFITLLIALKWPDTSKFLFVALVLRILILLIGHYFITLPDSTQDAVGFENLAWTWAQNGFFHTLDNYPGYNSFFYVWMNALLYSLFGRSLLMIQTVGLLFGVLSVFLGWLLAKKLWDERSALKVGWVLALFPSLVLYSIVPLREVYSSFFLLVAIFGIVNWFKVGGYQSIILVIAGFFGATHFHGVLLLGGVLFFIILSLSILKESYKYRRLNFQSFLIISLILIFLVGYLSNNIYVPYLGTFEQSINLGYLTDNISKRMKGDASYAEWTNINSPVEFFYKGFLRMLYFLFSPFPWNISKPTHVIGCIDGILYMILVYLIILNRKIIWKDPALRIILLILIFYFLIFGIGTSNFGAGLRHRSKFVIELIILAAPLIPKFIIFRKNKIKEVS